MQSPNPIVLLKYLVLCLAIIALSHNTQAQHKHLNTYYGTDAAKELCNNLSHSSTEMQNILNNILKQLDKNIYIGVIECPNVSNCQAFMHNNQPFILYNRNFMQQLKGLQFSSGKLPKGNQTDWATVGVLLHELGHILEFHFGRLANDRYVVIMDLELDADYYAGYHLYKLGATLKQAQSALYSPQVSQYGTSTHPPRSERLKKVAEGWNDAKAKFDVKVDPPPPPPPPVGPAPEYSVTAGNSTIRMKLIKGGTFKMGSNSSEAGKDEQPVHNVTLSDYYLGTTEVTYGQFKSFIAASSYKTDAEKNGYSWIYEKEWKKKDGINWRHNAAGETQNNNEHPVIHVSYNDALAYCKWLSQKTGRTFRLPTEAEWEYAAGNGSQHTKYSWGNGVPTTSNGGNVADETKSPTGSSWSKKFEGYNDGYWLTAPVAQFGSNRYGLYDMTGNVWEWCSDWYGEDFYSSSPSHNPTGPSSGKKRVIRGGSWSYYPAYCRVANRDDLNPANSYINVGFRLASSSNGSSSQF